MKKEELIKLSNRIQEKIGKEASALIQDDLGILITDNETTNSLIMAKEAEISKEKSLNENLIKANSSLFQQVGNQGSSVLNKNKPEETEEKPKITTENFSIKDCFDSKGNFIK